MNTRDSFADDLRQLERTAQQLWSTEPECSLDERYALMMRLSRVSTSLERLRFRTDFPVATGPDPFDIAVCRLELHELSARWPTGHEQDHEQGAEQSHQQEQRSATCTRTARPTTVSG